MKLQTLLDSVAEMVEEMLESASYFTAEEMGFDRRACHSAIYATKEWLAIPASSRRTFDYYGGMEYVKPENVQALGEYVIYMRESPDGEECERVARHIDRVIESDETDEEEDDEGEIDRSRMFG